MIGILLITHDTLGASLLAAATHVLGSLPPCVRTLAVAAGASPDALLPQAQLERTAVNRGTGVIVFADLYGATPCNLATRLVVPEQVVGIAGVNLPMLVRALQYRHLPLEDLTRKVLFSTHDSILRLEPPKDNPPCLPAA